MHCWFETNFFVKLYRNKLKGFLQRILQEIKKNTWNIRHLVNETIIPETKRIILKIDGFIIHTCYQFSTKSMLYDIFCQTDQCVCSSVWRRRQRQHTHVKNELVSELMLQDAI